MRRFTMADQGAPPIGQPAPGNLLGQIQAHHNRVKRPCQVCGRESGAWLNGAWQVCGEHYDFDTGQPKTG